MIMLLTELACHIIFCLFLRRIVEDIMRGIVFYQFTQIEKGSMIADAKGLLHIVQRIPFANTQRK